MTHSDHVSVVDIPAEPRPQGWCIRYSMIADCDDALVIRAALAFVVIFLVATFPATWLLMLFLGNIGTPVGYWGTLPMGILVSVLLGGVSASRYDLH